MKFLVKYIIYCFISIFLFSCSGGNGITGPIDPDSVYEINDDCIGTCLKGTLVDTVGGRKYPIIGARVSTIPSVDKIVESNEEGVFFIDSDQFNGDMKYNINIQKTGYIANSPSNLKVNMDTTMNLYEIVLTKIPDFKIKIDSISIKKGGGIAPKSD